MRNSLKQVLDQYAISYQERVPLAGYTTFHIGGPCEVMIFPKNTEELRYALHACRENHMRVLFLGNGSNMLVSDDGFDGAVILLNRDFSDITLLDDETIFAQSGASLAKVCVFAQQHGLTGMEFSYGIPASVGGAVYMNAGAYGGEMKDIIQSAYYLDGDLQEHFISAKDAQFSYRHSIFTDHPEYCVTGAAFRLKKGNPQEIKAQMDEIYGRRKSKQPLEFPSAGSTFKRPPNAFAAKLIEDCGLKGTTVGGAQVSEKHSGFVINRNHATCKDVLDLIELVKHRVKEQTGILLECEVKMVR
jgi:UDP-N-acetylmuramate dehydrogenase